MTTSISRALVVAAAGALLLAGCSGQDPAADASSAAAASPAASSSAARDLLPAAEGATVYPFTLESPFGETVLDERPQRIVAVSATGSDTELLAALGVTPVAADDTYQRSAWVLDALPGRIETDLVRDEAIPFEAVASADPDLIITLGPVPASEEEYDRLSTIAPVLYGATEEIANGSSWQEQIVILGQTLDLAGAAEEVVAQADAQMAQVRAENPGFAGKSVSYVVDYGTEYGAEFYTTAGSDPEQFFADLGFAAHPNAAAFVEDPIISPELVGLLDGDLLVVSVGDTEDPALPTDSELFAALPVAQAGHVAVFENTGSSFVRNGVETEGNLAWALAHPGPLGQAWAAENLAPILQEVLA